VTAAIAISYFDRQTLPVAISAIQRTTPLDDQQFSWLQFAYAGQMHNYHVVMASLNSRMAEFFPKVDVEVGNELFWYIFDGEPVPVDGYIDLDENVPGLGLTVNEESLKRFKIIELDIRRGMIHLVQIGDGSSRRVAIVEEPRLHCLTGVQSVYELAQRCLSLGRQLSEQAIAIANGELLDYDAIYSGASEWHLLAPIDVPGASSRLMIAGTGLTHLGSAKERQSMHLPDAAKATETVTDSMRMFQWGIEGGRPAEGEIGIAPEWFYKGMVSCCRRRSLL
jgi:hypothetical protein